MQIIKSLQEIVKNKEYSIAEIARSTGIKQDRIYKWLDGKGNPKAEDSSKLEKWLKGLEEIPTSELQSLLDKVLNDNPRLALDQISKNLWDDEFFLAKELKFDKVSANILDLIDRVYVKKEPFKKTQAHPVSMDKLAGVVLRTYAIQQVSLSVLSELLADKKGSSVTAIQSELLKAVEAEEVKMRASLEQSTW